MLRFLVLLCAVCVLTHAKSLRSPKTAAQEVHEDKKSHEATTIIPAEPKPLEFKTLTVESGAAAAEETKVVDVKEKPKKSRRGKKPRKQLAHIRVLNQDEVDQSNAVTVGRKSKVQQRLRMRTAESNINNVRVAMSPKQAKAISARNKPKGKT